jgi:spermidine/putrescine transport system permease protein
VRTFSRARRWITRYDRRPWGFYVVVAAIYIFLFAPIALVIVNSFNKDTYRIHWKGFTFHWYYEAWSNPTVTQAAKTSVIIALVVTVLATAIGTASALALQRCGRFTRGLIQSTIYGRLIIPELVLAIALLILLNRLNIARGIYTIILGHVVFNTAYVTVVVSARLAARDPATEEAARDLGATRLRAFRRVTLPEIMPAVLASALLAFTFSLDDVVTSYFLSGSTNTLPLVILSLIRFEVSPVVNALGTSLLFVNSLCLGLFLIANWRRAAASQRRAEAPLTTA